MTLIACLVVKTGHETTEFFKARVKLALDSEAAKCSIGQRSVATTLAHQGLFEDPRWRQDDLRLPSEVCFVARVERAQTQAYHSFDMSQLRLAPRNPEISRLYFQLGGACVKHRDRLGQRVELLATVETPTEEFGYDALPLLRVRFDDGLISNVRPDALMTRNVACAAAKKTLLEEVNRRLQQALEVAI